MCYLFPNNGRLLYNKAGLLENKAGLLKNTPRLFPITPKVNLMEDGRKILGKKTCWENFLCVAYNNYNNCEL